MRLFFALPLGESLRGEIAVLQETWRSLGVRGNFTPKENLHITLAFIGEYGDLEKVLDAVSKVSFSPFNLTLDGLGNFQDTYWLGTKKSPELAGLAAKIRSSLAGSDIPYDRKRFMSHITLMRKAEFWGGVDLLLKDLPVGSMEVEEILLLRSERGKNSMIYTPVGSIKANK